MEKWTVWVGGVEVNDCYLTKDQAERLARCYIADGYDDVKIERVLDWVLLSGPPRLRHITGQDNYYSYLCDVNKRNDMPTILETRFMEQMPKLMHQLLDELSALRKEVTELKEQLKKDWYD